MRLAMISKQELLSVSMSTTLNLRPLSTALQQKAIEELHEAPSRIQEDLQSFREWILKQPHLRSRMDDQFLIAFLRGCKYSFEKAKKKLDGYYTMRTNFPDLFSGFAEEQKARAILRMSIGVHLPLPLGEAGPRLLLIRPGHYDPDVINLYEIMKINILMNDLLIIDDDNCVISGFIQLLDFKEFTAKHLFQVQPGKMQRITHYVEEALPLRNKCSHFFNTGTTFQSMHAIMKPIIPAKVHERMFIHSSMESVYQHVPLKYFPKEYGGENGSIEEITASAEEFLMKYRSYLAEEKFYGTDEKLRPGKPIDFDAIFGVDGSFRKLEVD